MAKGFREFTRDVAMLPLLAAFGLFWMLVLNFISHVLHDRHSSTAVRPYFSLALLIICFSAIRFRNPIHLLFSGALLFLFNPIWPVHIGSWWLWQAIDWLALLFILVSGFFSGTMADRESKADYQKLVARQQLGDSEHGSFG